MRVLVLRAEDAARTTARALEDAGHEAIVAPVMRIVGTGAPLPGGRFDAILATSAQAFADVRGDLQGARDGAMDHLHALPVFAVGPATRDAARRGGFRDIRTSQGDARALVDLLRLTLPRPARLLYLAGRDRKPTIEEALGRAAYQVEILVRYEAVAVEGWPAEVLDALREGRLDAALHFSRRSAALALDLAGRHGLPAAFLALYHGCLSEDVATPLRAAGAAGIGIATRPDEAGLVRLLAVPGQ